MAKPPLSMKPTGWFQVAWSDEIGVGDVHTMHYFGQEMVAWRAESGQLTVMDAYCEHLGAHLGFGGMSRATCIECPFHGWQWEPQGRNVCIPYENRPNSGRRMRTYPVVERNESVYVWHDVEGRSPFFDVARRLRQLRDGSSLADYYPRSGSTDRAWNCIRSTCSKTGSTSRTSSSCTTPRSCRSSPATISMTRCPTSTSPSPSRATKIRRSTTSTVEWRRSTVASESR